MLRMCTLKNWTRQEIRAELRSCVKVEVAALPPVPNKPTISVDVKLRFNEIRTSAHISASENIRGHRLTNDRNV